MPIIITGSPIKGGKQTYWMQIPLISELEYHQIT